MSQPPALQQGVEADDGAGLRRAGFTGQHQELLDQANRAVDAG
jgi:hypothetical protein